MATIQLQKQQTVTTTAISQIQSQEVVQTVLHGGLSSLSYLREFFPDTVFAEQVYGEDKALPSYADYAAGNLPTRRASHTAESQSTRMQVLQRGRSRRVNKLLDWLEYGVFPAIKAGNLRALHVFVHADPEDRTQVIESYTFTVKYFRNVANQDVAAGIELGKDGSEPVTVGATGLALQQLIRHINVLCEGLPQLPAERYVSMALLYKENQTVPEGWMTATSGDVRFGEADGWMRCSDTLDGVFTAFHKTAFEISYLRQDGTGMTSAASGAIPNDLAYRQPLPLLTEDETAADAATAAEEPTSLAEPFNTLNTEIAVEASPCADSVPTEQLSPTIDTFNDKSLAMAVGTGSGDFSVAAPVALDAVNTQSSNVLEMKGAFQSMMQPERVTQGDTQTQTVFSALYPPSETTATPSRAARSPPAHINWASDSDSKLVLSQTSAARLKQVRARRQTRAKTKAKGAKAQVDDVVSCQCGHAEEEGDMVCCSVCDTWQHLHCYGLTGQGDPRVPDDHVCYQCLLGGSEPQTMGKLRELVQKRRLMHLLADEGAKRASEIAVSMQLTVTETASIIKQLDQAGFLEVSKPTKRASLSRTTYSAIKTGPGYEKMARDLFHPLALISHYYRTPVVENVSLEERVADMSVPEMPPPITPASRLMRLTQTPRAGSETPSKARNGAPVGIKRPTAAFDDAAHRAKRAQTEFILNAGGLPSSPASFTCR